MELTWEDGYFDNASSSDFLCKKSGIISFGCEIDIENGNSLKNPIEMAVSSLSHRSYQLGEGIVGQVASERKYQWTFADAADSRLHVKFPEEWNPQFVTGIKTILLVPVIPLGVVQLGSLNMVLEDLREVIRIRNYFGTIQNSSGTCVSSSSRIGQTDSYSQLITSSADLSFGVDIYGQKLGPDTGASTDDTNWKSIFKNLFAEDIEKPIQLDQSVPTDLGDMSDLYCLDDKLKFFPSISHKFIPDPYAKDLEHREGFRKEFDEETISVTDHTYFSFPSESELHKALGPSLKGHDDCIRGSLVSKPAEWSNSPSDYQIEQPQVCSPTFDDADAWFTEERRTEQLLDSMIAELLNTPDENESCGSRYVRSCSNSPSKCSDSCLTRCNNEDDSLDLGESLSCSHERSTLAFDGVVFTSSPAGSSDKSTSNVSIPDQGMAVKLYKKDPKSATVYRKRGNIAEVHKPKPRDRQLIQDRIKELRDLIPDGSKCSIDALLDRTIKHMLFLESVPSQAEKLRHSAEPKIKGESRSSYRHSTYQNGTSWAYEVGCQSELPPLIVENLDLPGQILVEMQCDDHGLFLDTAQVIRRLKLTILKGILDNKSDNRRAQFIVEAPRGFHRMDILWPLVQLLQRNNIPITKMF